MQNVDATVLRLQQAYQVAVFARDIELFMRLYDPAARVFDTWGSWQYEGDGAWRKAVESWFSSLGEERVQVGFDETRSAGSQEHGFTSSIVTYAAVSATGERLRSMQNRLTWGFHCDGETAVVLHEHTSAPIGFDGMKAILQYSPAT